MRVLGVDLGQVSDYTAFALVETQPGPLYLLRELYRVDLKTGYPEITEMVVRAMKHLEGLAPQQEARLVVDATGVGRPVVDFMRRSKLQPIAVTITGGSNEHYEDWCHRVPKRNLVSNAQVLLQQRQLKISDALKLGQTFVKELESFQLKIDPLTAHDSFAAGRVGEHDDLVMGVALALWWAQKYARALEPPGPKPGTPEWYAAQEEEYIKRLEARHREELGWPWSRRRNWLPRAI